jgi:RimJ/RimL family protein N-acetyltransferase
MSNEAVIRTERLILRPWRETDLVPFAALNADPRVMEFMPKVLDRDESDAMAERIGQHFARYGFGQWVVEIPGVAECAGYIGLSHPRFEASFTPCVEIGWRLAYDCWGHGYATEGAKATLAFGFERLQLAEILSFTVPANRRSWSVMERIGMTRDPEDDFDHPVLPEGHPLRRHVLYRIAPQ